MKLASKALVIVTAATLFCAAGCKKAENTTTTNETPVAEKAALVNVPSAPWVKEDVNALLAYIPADTAMVFTSTRQFDMDSPAIKEQLKKALTYFDQSIAKSEKELNDIVSTEEEKALVQKIMDNLKSMKPLLSDYENAAPEWGLDPKGHMDGAFYMVDKTLVMKMSVLDTTKLSSKLGLFYDSFIKEPLKLAHEQAPEITEIKAANTTWKAINLKKIIQPEDKSACIMCQDGKTVLNDLIVVNYDNNIVTVALVNEGDTATLEKILKPAEKPLDKAALGTVLDNTQLLGYIDNVKLFNVIAHSDMARILEDKDLLGEKLSDVCEKDISSIISLFPKYTIHSEMQENSVSTLNSTIVMADKEELKAIQDLTVEHIKFDTTKSLATFSVNIDSDKSITWLNALIDKVNAKKYECGKLNSLLPKSLKDDLKELNNPQLKMFTNAIKGINAAVDKFKKGDNGNYEIEAVANVTGPTIGSAYPFITGIFSVNSPETAKLMTLTKDEIAEKDLSQIIGMPLKVNALLSDKDLVVGTPTYDVKAITASEHKNDGIILSFSLDMAFLSALGLSTDNIGDVGSFSFELGVNADGIAINSTIAQ